MIKCNCHQQDVGQNAEKPPNRVDNYATGGAIRDGVRRNVGGEEKSIGNSKKIDSLCLMKCYSYYIRGAGNEEDFNVSLAGV